MNLQFGEKYERLRAEVRAFCTESWPLRGADASLAKAHITERAQEIARAAVEAHGGIGFTWECDVHIWFKRILFDRLWLGAPELHRERFGALQGW